MAKRHVMTSARKSALRKAQLASARRRHARRKLALSAGLVAVGVSAYVIHGRRVRKQQAIAREISKKNNRAFQIKQRRETVARAKTRGTRPQGKTVLLIHRTGSAATARSIANKGFKTEYAWFSTASNDKQYNRNMDRVYGAAKVKAYVPRKTLRRYGTQSGGAGQWHLVKSSALKGTKKRFVMGRRIPSKTGRALAAASVLAGH